MMIITTIKTRLKETIFNGYYKKRSITINIVTT